ncbi:LPXTG cell wall anchor domain-containing protein [Leucobacter coleopterorum]|uniref:LPXTG cell wall anchor domain-containing protein n=1 Tax=Leucobacter coleopterorum TaxID=2714933 RepID=A0ABX6K0H3_9MICO|nr:LPXTG cell wall anchor domain-containing protein [Leucobacter coleopterorum]QIM18709.1 LPXTG cell wall anchor domain-containing protein [Leucobacter coleopterorum]
MRWTEDDLAGLGEKALCELQPVAKTARVAIVASGRITSPAVTARSEGTIHWVEDLAIEHEKFGDPLELHRGICGLVEETTTVRDSEAHERLPQTGVARSIVITVSNAIIAAVVCLGLVLRRRSKSVGAAD